MRRTLLVLLALASSLLSAPATAGGVALAVALPDKSPVNRDFAAGMVSEAHDRFEMMRPQLTPEEVAACETEEACLLNLSRERAATHLLLVGVAALGPEEYVVSLRLLDVQNGEERLNLSDLASPGGDPHATGRALAARAFSAASDVPVKDDSGGLAESNGAATASKSASETGALSRWDGLTPLSLVGWGVTGLATVGAGAALLTGVALFSDTSVRVDDYAIWTGAAVAGGYAAGFGLVAADAFVVNPE